MEWRVVGVLGRGFAPAQPPRIRVSVVRVGKDASRDVGFGGSKPRENFDAIDPVREPVGDIRWRLETHVPWCETPEATLAASPNAGDNARTQSARQEIRIRVAGVGSVRIDMKAGNEDLAQRWHEVGDPSQGLQVRLVMKQHAGQQAERERLARRERIQRRQLELAMMRQLRPEKLLAWEERRAQRAARIIQRSWKSSRRHTKPRTETHVTRKRADDLALDDLIAEGDEDDEDEEDHDGEEDEDEVDVENDDNIGVGETNATKDDGQDPDAKEDAAGKYNRAKQATKRRSKREGADGSTFVSTTDEDSRRLHQLFDDLSREAHDRMVNGGRFSTHEKFQALMEGYRDLQTQWASFQEQDEEMREHEESRERLLRRSDKLCLRLEGLQVPLASYPDSNVSENQETALLAASDEIEAAHPRDAEETQSPAAAAAAAAAPPRWPLSRNRVVLEAARNAHATALENAQVGKEWWRVQVGHEERDIRTVKMGKAPWRVDTSSLISAKAQDGEDEDADAQASKWWVAYASKSAAQAEALAIKASNRVAQLDVFEDNVKRDTERLVREAEARLHAQESPLLRTALTCPPHRLPRLHKLLKAAQEQYQNKESTHVAGTTLPASQQESPAQSLRLASPTALSGRGSPAGPASLSVSVAPTLGSPRAARRGKRKKRSRRKEAAMQSHIEALEEQVAVLRSQMAHSQLEKLRASAGIGGGARPVEGQQTGPQGNHGQQARHENSDNYRMRGVASFGEKSDENRLDANIASKKGEEVESKKSALRPKDHQSMQMTSSSSPSSSPEALAPPARSISDTTTAAAPSSSVLERFEPSDS